MEHASGCEFKGIINREYNGGVLTVTGVPMIRCDDEDQVILGHAGIIQYYVKKLCAAEIIGDLTVQWGELEKLYSFQDILKDLSSGKAMVIPSPTQKEIMENRKRKRAELLKGLGRNSLK